MPKPNAKPKSWQDLFNGVASSALVPWIDQLMASVAKAIPSDSILRNPTLIRIADGILGYIENKTDSLGPIAGTLAEKGVNGLETLAALLGGKVQVEKHGNDAVPDAKTSDMLQTAQKKILAAKTPEEVKQTLELLEKQLEALQSFREKLTPKPDPQAALVNTTPHKTITQHLSEDVTPRLKGWREKLETAAARRNGGR